MILSLKKIDEWAREFRDYFSMNSGTDVSSYLDELEKIEDGGLYEISNETIGQRKSGYTMAEIFKNHPESSIIWSALEIVLFGDYAKYEVNKDGTCSYTLGKNRIRDIYNFFKDEVDKKCGRFQRILDALYEEFKIDNNTISEKNIFIEYAVIFLLNVLGFKDVNIPDDSRRHESYTWWINIKEQEKFFRVYDCVSEIICEIFDKFELLVSYKTKIDAFFNIKLTMKEKSDLNKQKSKITDNLNAINDFRKKEFVKIKEFFGCGLEYKWIQIMGEVRPFTYIDSPNMQGSKERLTLLNIKYDKKAKLEDLEKYKAYTKQETEDAINAAVADLESVITCLNGYINKVEDIILDFEESGAKDGGEGLKNIYNDAKNLKQELNDALNTVNDQIIDLDKISKEKQKEIRNKEVETEYNKIDSYIDETTLKILDAECKAIQCRKKAEDFVKKVEPKIEFLTPYVDRKAEYFYDIVSSSKGTNKIEHVKIVEATTKLKELFDIADEKSKNLALPYEFNEGTEILDDSGSKRSIPLKGEKKEIKVNIELLDEDFNELLFDANEAGELTRIRDYSAYHDLVDAAVDVKRQPIFSNYGDITKYPYFIPFKYQVDSVRTMLSRFEGRGVYAEQVGLGKTLQALMTADVIHRCGAIDNAVIIASKTNIPQWRREAEVKFRDENGEPMFEIFPKLTAEEAKKTGTKHSKEGFYNFKELNENIEIVKNFKSKDGTKKRKLNVFFISTNSIIGEGSCGIRDIRESNEIADLEYLASRPFTSKIIVDDVLENNLGVPLAEEKCIDKLYQMATSLYNHYATKVDSSVTAFSDIVLKTGDRIVKEKTIKWDDVLDKEWEIIFEDGTKDKKANKYNEKLEEIRKRVIELKEKIREGATRSIYTKKRLIDLLIFDEVQDILVPNSKNVNTTKATNAKTIQEFIARLQKRYCILISATPIKNDLSDIFNLHYMVDKNKLGATRIEAEKRFYSMYCDGCTSLSAMAEEGSKQKFSVLNGLINSMFTRKRLYDPDVKESMSRHTATPEEIKTAKENKRSDYGGEKFVKLVELLSECKVENVDDELRAKLLAFRNKEFPKKEFKLTDEQFIEAMKSLSNSVDTSIDFVLNCLEMKFKGEISFGNNINICKRFVDCYRKLIKAEKENKDTKDLKGQCDILCSCINRGFLDFFRVKHNFSTIFLSKYIDWTRPYKRGIALECDTKEQNINLLVNALMPADTEIVNNGQVMDENLIMPLKTGKVLVFEKGNKERAKIYRKMHDVYSELDAKNETYGSERKTYVNVTDETARVEYTREELINLCFFKKAIYNDLVSKDISTLSKEEQNYLNTWNENGTLKNIQVVEASDLFEEKVEISEEEKSHRNYNFKHFSEFAVEDGRWNAVYMIDDNQREGTDLNAANVLVINQLDKHNVGMKPDYLDPLEMEQLIGRISRVGQTEECLVYTFLHSKDNENNKEFNRVYYDILADEKGFNLFGACQTEVSFVVPVVMACMRRLFCKEHSFLESEKDSDKYKKDHAMFKAVYKNDDIPRIANETVRSYQPEDETDDSQKSLEIEKFPQMLKYLYDNRNDITIYYTKTSEKDETQTEEEIEYKGDKVIDAIKLMIQIYSEVLCHKTEDDTIKE